MATIKSESGKRWFVLIVTLFSIVLLAGCLSGPILGDQGQDGPVLVNLTNAADEPYQFRVLVVQGPPEAATYQVAYSDGRDSSEVAFSQGSSNSRYYYPNVSSFRSTSATSIQFPPNRTRNHSNYTLAPTETITTQIDEFETQDIVVVVIAREDRILEMNTVSCKGDLVGLGETMTPNGSYGGHYCR